MKKICSTKIQHSNGSIPVRSENLYKGFAMNATQEIGKNEVYKINANELSYFNLLDNYFSTLVTKLIIKHKYSER